MPSAKRLSWSVRVGLVVALLVVFVAACSNAKSNNNAAPSGSTVASSGGGGSSAPGVSKDEIKFSAIGTRTNNPLGTCVLDCFVQGVKAYFDYRNSQGGIYGRKLVLSKVLDDQLAQNQARALEVVSANDTFANFNAAQVGSGWADLAKAGIPTYVWAINPAQVAGHKEIFGNREAACINCVKRSDAYVAKVVGAKKVATLGYGVSDNSKQCAQAAAQAYKQYGNEVGGATAVYTNDHLDFGLPNGIGPEVTAMKNAGVDLIIGCIDLNGMKTLAQELKRQGMRDKVTMYHTNTYDQAFVAKAGGLFDGDFIQATFRPFEAAPIPSATAYKEWMAKNGSTLTELAMDGWINADLAYQGIKAAGPNFTRQSVIDATNKMTAYTAGGLVQPIDWSRQHDAPTPNDPATHGPKYDCIALVRVKAGAFQVVGDPAKPFTCWPGQTSAWSEPKAMNFQ